MEGAVEVLFIGAERWWRRGARWWPTGSSAVRLQWRGGSSGCLRASRAASRGGARMWPNAVADVVLGLRSRVEAVDTRHMTLHAVALEARVALQRPHVAGAAPTPLKAHCRAARRPPPRPPPPPPRLVYKRRSSLLSATIASPPSHPAALPDFLLAPISSPLFLSQKQSTPVDLLA